MSSSMPNMLRAMEAAVVAGVTLREVHRAIDEAIVPARFVRRDGDRRLDWRACPLIAFYSANEPDLSAELRRAAIDTFAKRLEEFFDANFESRKVHSILVLHSSYDARERYFCHHHKNIIIDAHGFLDDAVARLDRLRSAEDLVVRDPEILGGAPVLTGTRVPVRAVAAMLDEGLAPQRIAELYPGLDPERITLAGFWARANPARGRPRVQTTRSGNEVRRVRRTLA